MWVITSTTGISKTPFPIFPVFVELEIASHFVNIAAQFTTSGRKPQIIKIAALQ
jgi:hypothetical protein